MNFPICINCDNLMLWKDGFVCVGKMKALVCTKKLNKDTLIEFPTSCTDFSENTDELVVDFMRETFSNIIAQNEQKMTF